MQPRRTLDAFKRLNPDNIPSSSSFETPSIDSKIDFPDLSCDAPTQDEDDTNEESSASDEGLSCAYCGFSDPLSLVYSEKGKRWFCNGRTKSSQTASHIINHLVRSKSKEVVLNSAGPLGDTDLECYCCGCRNVFLLGFVPAQTHKAVVILCRQPCASQGSLKELSWDIEEWEPLIQNRQFLPWLVRVPTEHEMATVSDVGSNRIIAMEKQWKRARLEDEKSKDGSAKDTEENAKEEEPERVEFKYNDAAHYSRIFGRLVELESREDRKLKESLKQEDIEVRWDMGLNRKRVAYFTLPKITDQMRLNVGDELRLKLRAPVVWSGVGNVIKVPNSVSDEIGIEFKMISPAPVEYTTGFVVEFVWKPTSYDRMKSALDDFITRYDIGEKIRKVLLGINEDQTVRGIEPDAIMDHSCPGLPKLNKFQEDAVRRALRNHVTLIQGPPGTGKTVTSASIVYHLFQSLQSPILVCAPSNIAVDQLTEKINRTGLRVVRVCAKSRELVDSSVSHLALHNLTKTYKDEDGEFIKLQQLKEEMGGELSEADERRYGRHKRRANYAILKDADVICTTCVGSGDNRLAKITFEAVLIDESTQATEPECLIPLVRGCKRVILVGDHCQLGPVVMCKQASRAGLNQSMFERFIVNGLRAKRLNVQYRMHPALSEFPSNTFYDGSLQNGIGASDRPMICKDFPWPRPDCPLMFYCSFGTEEISGSGTSYLNRSEASMIEKMITRLLKAGIEPEQLGIVTPYEGQRAYIVHFMKSCGALPRQTYERVEVASVDAFQGREKDFIIVSCVRSNDQQIIGFLSDVRRLNVAITRAKYGLILVGNPRVLAKQPIYNTLLLHMKKNRVLVEGPLNALQQTTSVVLTQPNFNLPLNLGSNSRPNDNFDLITPSSGIAIPQFPLFMNQFSAGINNAMNNISLGTLPNPQSYMSQLSQYSQQSSGLHVNQFVGQPTPQVGSVNVMRFQQSTDIYAATVALAESSISDQQRRNTTTTNLAALLGMSSSLSQFSQRSSQFSQQQQPNLFHAGQPPPPPPPPPQMLSAILNQQRQSSANFLQQCLNSQPQPPQNQ